MSGIRTFPSAALRQAYPRGHQVLERAIAEALAGADSREVDVTDLEVHADHLRLTLSGGGDDGAGEGVRIPFDLAGITPRGGDFDVVLDQHRECLLLSGHDPDERASRREEALLDALRPYYRIVRGATEFGVDPLLLVAREARGLLRSVLERTELAVIHPQSRAALKALERGGSTSAGEFDRSLRAAGLELRRCGLAADVGGRLEALARSGARLRRAARPVLAMRTAARREILRAFGLFEVEALRAAFSRPGALTVLTASYAVDAATISRMDRDAFPALVDELRECEFFEMSLSAALRPHDAAEPVLAVAESAQAATKLLRSFSRTTLFLFSREQSRDTDRAAPGRRPVGGPGRAVGFFPGLGSRSAYRDVGRTPLEDGNPEIVEIHLAAARAIGLSGRPEALLLTPENLPAERLEQQGFLGAALFVHSLALEARLRAAAAEARAPLDFAAYTGESFGIITAAVAAGSLSVFDGAKIARAFTPLMLIAAEGADPEVPLVRELAAYLPATGTGPLAPEPFHVVGLTAEPGELAELFDEIDRFFPQADVEVHKLYSPRQTNVYVRAGAKSAFDGFVGRHPAVRMEELKAPTRFLAHSRRMHDARAALARFIDEQGIVFGRPRVPVVSNHGAGLLTTAAEVRAAILAIVDEVMASRATVESIEGLRPDLVLELGLGGKSVRLLLDNGIEAPVTAYTGAEHETPALLDAVLLADRVSAELEKLHDVGDEPEPEQQDLLRELFRLGATHPFCERYLHRTMTRAINAEMLHPARSAAPAFRRFLELYQNTYDHRRLVDAAGGELVLQSRLRKRILGGGGDARVGGLFTELKVIDAADEVSSRGPIDVERSEAVVFSFDRLAEVGHAELARRTRLLLDSQPAARRIFFDAALDDGPGPADDGFLTAAGATAPTARQTALAYIGYQYAMFQVLRLHRPALFEHDCYLLGADPMGWLVALAVSDAATLPAVVQLYAAHLHEDAEPGALDAALDRLAGTLGEPGLPLIAPDGAPLQTTKELEAATRDLFR